MLKEFKAFILRGNVLDLAVAVIIGGAFGKIITSLVNDILMPPIGMLLGKMDFTNLFWAMDGGSYASLKAAEEAGAPLLKYGLFINNIIDFLLVALVIFLVIRAANTLIPQKAEEAPAPTTKECPYCLSTIPLKATRCPHCTSQL